MNDVKLYVVTVDICRLLTSVVQVNSKYNVIYQLKGWSSSTRVVAVFLLQEKYKLRIPATKIV